MFKHATLHVAKKKKSVVNMGIRLYNRLPVGIKSAESFKDFKIKLRTSLL